MNNIKQFILQQWLVLVGILVGIVCAIMIIYLGFFETLLVIILAAIGGSLGFYIQQKLNNK